MATDTNGGEAAEIAKDGRGRDRSPSFPFISLKDAVDRVKSFEATQRKFPARVQVAAELWKLSPKSSTMQQTIAALKAFGLMKDSGSGSDRKVEVTDLALRVLKDERPGKRDEAIKEAALKPKLIAEHWRTWGTQRPPDSSCLSDLHLDRGFTEDAAARFLGVYDDTIEFAKLRDDDKTGTKGEEDYMLQLPKVGDLIQWESAGVLQFSEPKPVAGVSEDGGFLFVDGSVTGIPVSEVTVVQSLGDKPVNPSNPSVAAPAPPAAPLKPPPAGTRQDTWHLDDGLVVLQYPAKMSAANYEDFEAWIQLQLRKIKRGIEQ